MESDRPEPTAATDDDTDSEEERIMALAVGYMKQHGDPFDDDPVEAEGDIPSASAAGPDPSAAAHHRPPRRLGGGRRETGEALEDDAFGSLDPDVDPNAESVLLYKSCVEEGRDDALRDLFDGDITDATTLFQHQLFRTFYDAPADAAWPPTEETLRVAAMFGSAKAKCALAMALRFRLFGLEDTRNEAVSLLKAAAEDGFSRAYSLLGLTCEIAQEGDSELDLEKAQEWYWIGVAEDDGWSLCFAGLAQLQDCKFTHAAGLFARGAEQDHQACIYQLGMMHKDGEGCQEDLPTAISLFVRAAAGPEIPNLPGGRAALELARCYQAGNGVEVDFAEARRWAEIAIGHENGNAAHRLGTWIELGELGEPPDLEQAFRYFEMSAKHGDPAGLYKYSQCRLNGWGCDEDLRMALAALDLAAERGYRIAKTHAMIVTFGMQVGRMPHPIPHPLLAPAGTEEGEGTSEGEGAGAKRKRRLGGEGTREAEDGPPHKQLRGPAADEGEADADVETEGDAGDGEMEEGEGFYPGRVVARMAIGQVMLPGENMSDPSFIRFVGHVGALVSEMENDSDGESDSEGDGDGRFDITEDETIADREVFPDPIEFVCGSGELLVTDPIYPPKLVYKEALPLDAAVPGPCDRIPAVRRGVWCAEYAVIEPYDDRIGSVTLHHAETQLTDETSWDVRSTKIRVQSGQLCFLDAPLFGSTPIEVAYGQMASPIRVMGTKGDVDEGKAGAASHYGVVSRSGLGEGMFTLMIALEGSEVIGLRLTFIDDRQIERWQAKFAGSPYGDPYNVDSQFATAASLHGDENYAEAARWFERAAKQGHIGAMCAYATYLNDGAAGETDLVEAARWLRKAVDSPQATPELSMVAKHQLGKLLSDGEGGVQQDLDEAAVLFKESAEAGYGPSMASIGLAYFEGEGVEADPDEAMRWFRKGADECNDFDCRFSLGHSYHVGEGVEMDLDKALEWYEKALEIEPESEKVIYNMGLLMFDLPGSNPFDRGLAFATPYAQEGYPLMQLLLAIKLRERDPAASMEWARKADEEGLEEAAELLEELAKEASLDRIEGLAW